ncbi:MAG: NAD(P)-dependent glycerol-3-phosphate dehydrogenase [Acidobacteria bacterium]|nr:NAD(P)-dependent glycerol-3-phosphate dehydrogenase [Acidobacteriota bacterium]
MERVAVIGSGSWGTALAAHLASAHHQVRMWARDAALVEQMQARRANPVYLPEITFPAGLEPTADLREALEEASVVIVAVPSHGVRAVAHAMHEHLQAGALVVSAVKGIEAGSLLRMSEVLMAELPRAGEFAVLSGPSFALELARQQPTAVVIASASAATVEHVQAEFRAPWLRLYGTADVVGVEMGGALKNTIAIAAGVVEGLGQGHNALAALITRGLAEVTRLAVAMGGQRETLAGLAGLGDLVLTCTGGLSRNRYVGVELARGRRLDEVLGSMKMVAEGVRTTEAALALGARHRVELPITEQMAEVLSGRKDVPAALRDLMGRRQKPEHT